MDFTSIEEEEAEEGERERQRWENAPFTVTHKQPYACPFLFIYGFYFMDFATMHIYSNYRSRYSSIGLLQFDLMLLIPS